MTDYETVEIINGFEVQLNVNAGGFLNCRIIKNGKLYVASINHRTIQDDKLWAKRWLENNHKI